MAKRTGPCLRCNDQPRASTHGYCKPCHNDYKRERYANSKTAKRQGIQLTWTQYETLLDEQNGLCAICHQPPGDRALHVDHDHTTGTVRALLCSPCNQGLGYAQDNPATLRAMANYLEAHQQLRLTFSD